MKIPLTSKLTKTNKKNIINILPSSKCIAKICPNEVGSNLTNIFQPDGWWNHLLHQYVYFNNFKNHKRNNRS